MTLNLRPLPKLGRELTGPVRVNEIQRIICDTFGIGMVDLLSDRRARSLSQPRQAAYLLAREFTFHSLPALAKMFRRQDHTTLIAGVEAARRRAIEDIEYRGRVEAARAMIVQLGRGGHRE